MKKLVYLFFLLVICFAGCNRKTNNTQGVIRDNNDSVLLLDRVGMMYNEVFSYHNKKDFVTIDFGRKFFTEKLKALWDELPTDEESVVDADPWTWMLEPDSFVYKGSVINQLCNDTAEVLATIQGYDPYYDLVIHRTIKLVREGGNWMVDDFRDSLGNPFSSILHMMEDDKRIHEARQRVEDIYSELLDRYNKNETIDENSYITTKLKDLWERLPKDELVYGFNVWTGGQDFDSLANTFVYLDNWKNSRRDEQRKDTVIVSVLFITSSKYDKFTEVYVKAVYEKDDWYIDDILHNFNDREYSIQKMASSYVSDSCFINKLNEN